MFFYLVEAERRGVQRERAEHQTLSVDVLFVLCPIRPILLQGLRGQTGSS